MHEVRIFPEVTTSKKEFLEHIENVCTTDGIEDDIKKDWIEHIKVCNADGHYFLNLIYIKFISLRMILHEYVHHVTQQLNTLTNSNVFWSIDGINDSLYILL